jgi:hypothetical protein
MWCGLPTHHYAGGRIRDFSRNAEWTEELIAFEDHEILTPLQKLEKPA